jgi:O-antigen biosynthesis protein
MKLSLFTPTHRPGHLLELYASLLKQQGNVDWEWIIVPNGGITSRDIPPAIQLDPHVRIVESSLKGIGALKRFCCEQATGDVFVEIDHDDQLCQTAFAELAQVYQKEPNGFYYSDFVNVKPDGTCETYGRAYGWESYPCTVNDKHYIACRAFAPTARALSQIFYAPNHIRAWSRVAYEQSQGHDANLAVGDDHELLCRTYIAGVPFVWIDKPIYLYRRYNENTFVLQNKAIQTQQAANCDKYLHKLILEEGKRSGLKLLDVGRYQWCAEGYSSYDLIDYGTTDEDCLADFADNSIFAIRANDFFQRVPTRKVVTVINEMYRVLAPGGWIVSSTPSIDDGNGGVGRGAHQDPSHQSYWSANNFWYFTDIKYANLLPGLKAKFQAMRVVTDYPSEWHTQNRIPYVHADLSALKGQRQPGPKKF